MSYASSHLLSEARDHYTQCMITVSPFCNMEAKSASRLAEISLIFSSITVRNFITQVLKNSISESQISDIRQYWSIRRITCNGSRSIVFWCIRCSSSNWLIPSSLSLSHSFFLKYISSPLKMPISTNVHILSVILLVWYHFIDLFLLHTCNNLFFSPNMTLLLRSNKFLFDYSSFLCK